MDSQRRDVDFQRRDVDSQRRDVDFQRRVVDFNDPLERRDVDTQRRDVVNPTLCNVATLPRTLRRHLVHRSVTSRRCPTRRDVGFNDPLERCDVDTQRRNVVNPTLYNVTTLPRTSRRRLVHRSITSRRCPARRDVALF